MSNFHFLGNSQKWKKCMKSNSTFFLETFTQCPLLPPSLLVVHMVAFIFTFKLREILLERRFGHNYGKWKGIYAIMSLSSPLPLSPRSSFHGVQWTELLLNNYFFFRYVQRFSCINEVWSLRPWSLRPRASCPRALSPIDIKSWH